jgi:dipeptidyl aminopeptidase/acylaminoacyl peptidase
MKIGHYFFFALVAVVASGVPRHGMAQPSAAPATKYASAAEIPVKSFFRRAQYAQMLLSPDGKKLGAIAPANGRDNLVIIDLEKRSSAAITSFSAEDVSDFRWIDNDRLFLRVADTQEETGNLYLKGVYAINADGQFVRNLSKPTTRHSLHAGTANRFNILSQTFDGTGEVIVEMNERNRNFPDVYRYNTRTGEYKLLTADSPGNVMTWVVDRDLTPRIAVRREERADSKSERQNSIWHRTGLDQPWQLIGYSSNAGKDGSIIPLSFDFDNKTLYVSSNIGRDRRALYKYDIANKKLGDLVAEHPLIDLNGGLIFSRAKKTLIGIRKNAEKPTTDWLDADMQKFQAQIDKALPNTINTFRVADDNEKYLLVNASSEVEPGVYYLYNSEKMTLEQVAKSREWLPPEMMSERRFIKYKARDGLEIPAWVTIPKSASAGSPKNLPLIVHIHGGPYVRSYYGAQWGRWPSAQFFASRGYVVLEPEPRGSTGFGRKHYASGLKQWGLAMQDDITDGALHLVAEGIVNKDRMCLFGGSYGGYATLQGLIKDPDLWRCGSAYVAVSDLELLQTVTWSDTARLSDYFETDYKRLVGDKDTDREQFQKTSPAKNADKIKAPLMLTMGGQDVRVPLIHGTTMRDAMEKAGKKIDYKVYGGEAHGFNKDENVVDFYSRMEQFFAEHLKK